MPTAAPVRSRTRLDAEVRRDQILAHARRLFGERPYAAVSLADIAREAGVARGLVNHYFGGKRQLYLEVLRGMVAIPEWVVERLPGGSLEDRARGIIDRFLDVVERNRGIWLVTMDAMTAPHDATIERVMRQAQDVTFARVIGALGLDEHVVDDQAMHAMVRAYGSMVRAATAEWLTHATLTRQQTADLLQRTLLVIVRDLAPSG